MSFFNLFRKKTFVLEDVTVWTVKWMKRTGEYASDRKETVETFLSQEDARRFISKLKEAKALLCDTDNIHVEMERIDCATSKKFHVQKSVNLDD